MKFGYLEMKPVRSQFTDILFNMEPSLNMQFSISNTDFHLFVGLHCHFVAEIKTKLYFASPFDLFVLFCLQNETTDRKLVPT